MTAALEEVGTVSSEGGPLLLADRTVAVSWRGAVEASEDYDRACQIFEVDGDIAGAIVQIGRGHGVIWSSGGSGTSAVFRSAPDHALVVWTWLEDPDDPQAVRVLAEAPVSALTPFAELSITSGTLAVLWAPEDGSALGETSTGGTWLTLELAPGLYDCFQDTVANAAGDAIRCHVIRRKV